MVALLIWLFSNYDRLSLRFVYFFLILIVFLMSTHKVKITKVDTHFYLNCLCLFAILTFLTGVVQTVALQGGFVDSAGDWKAVLQKIGFISNNISEDELVLWSGDNAVSGLCPVHHQYGILLGVSCCIFWSMYLLQKRKYLWLGLLISSVYLLFQTESLSSQISFLFVMILNFIKFKKESFVLLFLSFFFVAFLVAANYNDSFRKQTAFLDELFGKESIGKSREDRFFHETQTVNKSYKAFVPILKESSTALAQQGIKPHSGFTMIIFNFGLIGAFLYVFFLCMKSWEFIFKPKEKNMSILGLNILLFYLVCGFGIGIFSSFAFIPIIGLVFVLNKNENCSRN